MALDTLLAIEMLSTTGKSTADDDSLDDEMREITDTLREEFAERIVSHFKDNPHGWPWRRTREPYRIWVAVVLLQRVSPSRMLKTYNQFLETYPNIHCLAAADPDELLALTKGMGNKQRFENMIRAAKIVAREMDGEFPQTYDGMIALPGLGRTSAGLVLSLAFEQRQPILETNVRRVLSRVFLGQDGDDHPDEELWAVAEEVTPESPIRLYNLGIMDFGAQICKRTHPQCSVCPIRGNCAAYAAGQQGVVS